MQRIEYTEQRKRGTETHSTYSKPGDFGKWDSSTQGRLVVTEREKAGGERESAQEREREKENTHTEESRAEERACAERPCCGSMQREKTDGNRQKQSEREDEMKSIKESTEKARAHSRSLIERREVLRRYCTPGEQREKRT